MKNTSNLSDGGTCNRTLLFEPESKNIIVIMVALSACLWIVLCNAVVIVCFIRNSKLRNNAANFQILTLSITDFLLGIGSFIISLTYTNSEWFRSNDVCAFVFVMYFTLALASLFHMFWICMYRFIIVTWHLRKSNAHSVVKSRYILSQIAIAWILAVLMAFVLVSVNSSFESKLSDCSMNSLFGENYQLFLNIYSIFSLSTQFIINVLYIVMYWKIKSTWITRNGFLETTHLTKVTQVSSEIDCQSPERIHATEKTNLGSQHMLERTNEHTSLQEQHDIVQTETIHPSVIIEENSEPTADPKEKLNDNTKEMKTRMNLKHCKEKTDKSRKAMITIGLVLLTMNVCVTPANLMFVIESFTSVWLSRETKFVIVSLALVNAGVNPIIYAFRIKPLRQTCKEIFILQSFRHR